MRLLFCTIAAAAIMTGCSADSKSASPTPAIDEVTPALPTPSSQPTSTSACPTPPAESATSLAYTGAATAQGQAVLSGVQSATSACSDTTTFTFAGTGVPGYTAKYVPAVSQCGSGQPVTTAGPAQIYLRLEPAVAHDSSGHPTLSTTSQAPGFPSIMELKLTCDFEGVVAWAIGTPEKYFSVTTASAPSRIIVEVYH